MGNLSWFSKREAPKVIMLGISYSGKTTIFRHLTKKSDILIPVISFTIEHAECEKVKLMSWDIRTGSEASIFKQFYRKYYG
jgi:ABC-type phosphate/phosphonate transport system ATPase subunit